MILIWLSIICVKWGLNDRTESCIGKCDSKNTEVHRAGKAPKVEAALSLSSSADAQPVNSKSQGFSHRSAQGHTVYQHDLHWTDVLSERLTELVKINDVIQGWISVSRSVSAEQSMLSGIPEHLQSHVTIRLLVMQNPADVFIKQQNCGKKCDHSARWLDFTIFKTATLLGFSPQMSLEFTQRHLSKKQPKNPSCQQQCCRRWCQNGRAGWR